MPTDLGPWEPMAPHDAAGLLADVGPWWIAGGWALDLHLGRQTRPHGDLDVLVLRQDLPRLQRALAGWDLHAADPPGHLRPWRAGEVLPTEVHDLWCRRSPDAPWSLQVMVDEATDGIWHYRRDPRVTRPVESLGRHLGGLPVLAPEVQLLHKSKASRPRDEADLDAVGPSLSDDQRAWLRRSLALVSPGHTWLTRL